MHYNETNSQVFANGEKITDFTAKDLEINDDPICLGNISKYFSESDTNKTGLFGSVYYFSVDYRPVTVNNIIKIHEYLMNKCNIK